MTLIVRALVPTKVTLLGEHTVVYGEPAIVIALDKRLIIEMRRRNDNVITIRSSGLTIPNIEYILTPDSYPQVRVDSAIVSRFFSYIIQALSIVEEELSVRRKGVDILVESSLPPGVGLGTSAAISVGTIAAYSFLQGHVLEPREIARLGHRVELSVQGAASPMDTSATTFGGMLYIEPSRDIVEKLPITDIHIVVGYVPKKFTTAELVRQVRNLRNKYGELINPIIKVAGSIVKNARKALEKRSLEKLGELMNIFHGILEALGVVETEVARIVHVLRLAGALGAKMSGAGGGGAFVALARSKKDAETLRNVIKSLGASVVDAGIANEGLRIEQVGI